jgi:hypothetical protein
MLRSPQVAGRLIVEIAAARRALGDRTAAITHTYT